MNTATLLPALSMTTLGLALLVIVVGFAIFWSKRSNRAPRDGGTPTDGGSV
jgi:hypothetical protein